MSGKLSREKGSGGSPLIAYQSENSKMRGEKADVGKAQPRKSFAPKCLSLHPGAVNTVYLFRLQVRTIPTIEPIRTKGATLTNTNSIPWSMVPAAASSGSL